MDQKKVLKIMKSDVLRLERKIKYSSYYNFRNSIIRFLIRGGYVTYCASPFLLSAFAIFLSSPKNHRPFIIDKVSICADKESIDTSLGKHIERVGFNIDKNEEGLRYFDDWDLNEYSLYERDVTSYKVDKDDLVDIDSILCMSKEELDNNYSVKCVEKIQQIALNEEDEFFQGGVIVVTSIEKDSRYMKITQETWRENYLSSIQYIYSVVLSGGAIVYILYIVLDDKIRNFTNRLLYIYREMDLKDIVDMKMVLDNRLENLSLVSDNNKNYQRILKK